MNGRQTASSRQCCLQILSNQRHKRLRWVRAGTSCYASTTAQSGANSPGFEDKRSTPLATGFSRPALTGLRERSAVAAQYAMRSPCLGSASASASIPASATSSTRNCQDSPSISAPVWQLKLTAAKYWVTGTVKDLVAGSEIRFESRGPRELKGVGEWPLFAVTAA